MEDEVKIVIDTNEEKLVEKKKASKAESVPLRRSTRNAKNTTQLEVSPPKAEPKSKFP